VYSIPLQPWNTGEKPNKNREPKTMKICAAQTKPVTGDILSNIEQHKRLAKLAASRGAGLIIFPELSLTGYEPQLAGELATTVTDRRLVPFQKISNENNITIGAGVPIRGKTGTCISMIIFRPNKQPLVYSKKHLHPDEAPFFVGGNNICCIEIEDTKIALAICYELSVEEHHLNAAKTGADFYIASVAKFKTGLEDAMNKLSEIARRYQMTVLMANCSGTCDGNECAGKTSMWNNRGRLVAQLDEDEEGLLMIDTKTGHKSVWLLEEKEAFAY
jgi:predicted amidohydrolase